MGKNEKEPTEIATGETVGELSANWVFTTVSLLIFCKIVNSIWADKSLFLLRTELQTLQASSKPGAGQG
jgi:hypothetical protein